MLGSPEFEYTPPHATRPRRFSGDFPLFYLMRLKYKYCICVLLYLLDSQCIFISLHLLLKWALPVQQALAGPTVICTRPMDHLTACAMVTQMPWQQTSMRVWHLCHLNCQRRHLWRLNNLAIHCVWKIWSVRHYKQLRNKTLVYLYIENASSPQEGHTDLLSRLRFILAFSHCITEVARTKDSGTERNMALDASFLEQSMVADQISLLSREWRWDTTQSCVNIHVFYMSRVWYYVTYAVSDVMCVCSSAEQLVLYMKCAELLSSALHTAMAGIKDGKLYPSGSVKQGKPYTPSTLSPKTANNFNAKSVLR